MEHTKVMTTDKSYFIEMPWKLLAELNFPSWIEKTYFAFSNITDKDERAYYDHEPGKRTMIYKAGSTIRKIMLHCSLVLCWDDAKIVQFLVKVYGVDNTIIKELCKLNKQNQYKFTTCLARYKRFYSHHLYSFIKELLINNIIELQNNSIQEVKDLTKNIPIDVNKASEYIKDNNIKIVKTENQKDEKPNIIEEVKKISKTPYKDLYKAAIKYIDNDKNIKFIEKQIKQFRIGYFSNADLSKYTSYKIYDIDDNFFALPDIFKPVKSFGKSYRKEEYACNDNMIANIEKETLKKYNKLIIQCLCADYYYKLIYAFLCLYDDQFYKENPIQKDFEKHITMCLGPYYSVHLQILFALKDYNSLPEEPSYWTFINNIENIINENNEKFLQLVKNGSKSKDDNYKNIDASEIGNTIIEGYYDNIYNEVMRLFMSNSINKWTHIDFKNSFIQILKNN